MPLLTMESTPPRAGRRAFMLCKADARLHQIRADAIVLDLDHDVGLAVAEPEFATRARACLWMLSSASCDTRSKACSATGVPDRARPRSGSP